MDEPFFDHSALFSFTSGSGGFGFTIPGDVPFISGSTLSLSIPGNYPTLMILPSGMGMFSWGYDFAPESATWKTDDTQDQERAIKEFDKQSAADKLLAAAGVYRNVNTTTTPKLLGDYGVHITPFAAMQGLYRRSDQSLELRGNGGATFAFEAGFTQTFTIGPVPFFAGIDFSMGASFGVGISLNMKAEIENGLLKVKEGPVIGYDSGMTISFRLELGGTIGLGLKDVLSVSLRGYGYINPIIHLTTPRVSAEARIGIGLSVTLRALFLKWSTTLWEGNLPLSSSDSIALTASGKTTTSSSWRDYKYAEAPSLAAANDEVTAVNASGVEPATTQKLFERIDCSAGNFQYVVVGGDTYLFWIQPGKGDTDWERVNWYNLKTTERGQVTWTGNSAKRDNTKAKYQDWFVDYDFTVEPSRDIQGNSSNFCALTILSGRFAKPTSKDEVNPPQEACAASVLMQKQSDGKLEVVYYREETGNFTYYSYPTMPEVFLTATNNKLSSVFMVNTYVRSDEKKVSGLVVSGNNKAADFSCTALKSYLFENGKEIARYHVGEPTAVSASAPEEDKEEDKMNFYVLSVLGTNSVLARIRKNNRQELAKGDIVNFKVVTRINGIDDKDTLFYLDRVKTDEGGFIHRLKGVTLSPQSPEKPVTVTDYDIEVNADRFDTVKFGGGIYLYWTECSTPNTNVVPDAKAEYLVRCVRYDPDTDTICDPFTLVQLGESPSSVKLQDSGTGFYAVDLGNKNGSYLRQSLTKFTYQLVMSAELQAAVPNDPCVCAGDYIDLILSVRNTGNLPLSGLNVAVKKGSQVIQTLQIDCTQPQESTNLFFAANGNLAAEPKGVYTIRRIDGMYDALNGESWNITSTNSNGVTTQRNVRTTLLMPGDTQSYKAKLLIPADWDGKVDLTAEIVQTVGAKQFGALLTENGRPLSNALVLTTDATNDDPVLMRLTPEMAHKIVNTDSHDLMLSAQLFNREGETYVRVSILNRSGNTGSRVVPTLTSSYNGQTLFSHTFQNAMEDDYGYSMDIPLQTLTAGRRLDELDLNVSSKENYEEFADADNHVRLSLFPKLYIAQQPESLNLVEKQDALFVVSADGGQRPYRYQWQKLNAEGRWVDLPGANQDSYQLPKVTLAQSGLTLRCVVTDEAGDSVTSDSAVLSVFSLPQTGDETQPALWMLLAVASAALIALLCFRRRKDD